LNYKFLKTNPYIHQVTILLICALGWQILPDMGYGPYLAINPHDIFEFIFIALAISFFASLFIRFIDDRYGVIFAGFLGGFASSTATIHQMGEISKADHELLQLASIGALLSNVATLVQILILTHLLAKNLFLVLILPVSFGVALLFATALFIYIFDQKTSTGKTQKVNLPFNYGSTFALGLMLLVVTVVSTGLSLEFGSFGLILSSIFSGLADAHSIIASVANMLKSQAIDLYDAKMAVFTAFTSNSLFKVALAFKSGGVPFAKRIGFAIALCNLGVWALAVSL